MAYDSSRGRVVLFGGGGPYNLADTWEWDGNTWTQKLSAINPAARDFHAMAYDLARHRVVLFGGDHNPGLLGDTWVWDGTTWVMMNPAASPSARELPAMAYDSARERIVLFGGWNDSSHYLSDTWEWNGTTWVQMTSAVNPPARRSAAMTYDSARGRIVLYGGDSATGGSLGDTWEWDGVLWVERLPATVPPPRSLPAMSYDSARRRVVLFGGAVDTCCSDDTWEWDGSTWTPQTPTTKPPARSGHALAYDFAEGAVILFGGWGNFGDLGDTWTYQSSDGCTGVDDDGDGYYSGAGCGTPRDCNDADPNTHPGAVEACDGYDNDCDGMLDNSLSCNRTCSVPDQVGNAVPVAAPAYGRDSWRLVWNGLGFGAAWGEYSPGVASQIMFRRIGPAGTPIGASLPVSASPQGATQPAFAWTGDAYGFVWTDSRDTTTRIFFTLLDESGVKLLPDLPVSTTEHEAAFPSIVWSGSEFGVAWGDRRTGHEEVFFRRIDKHGIPRSAEIQVTNTQNHATTPVLGWRAPEYAIAWYDSRPNATTGVFFTRLDAEGVRLGNDVEVSETNGDAVDGPPQLLATSGGYSITWNDRRTGIGATFLKGVSAAGEMQTADINVCTAESSSLAYTGAELATIRPLDSNAFVRFGLDGVVAGFAQVATHVRPVLAWTGSTFGSLTMVPATSVLEFTLIGCQCPDADHDGWSVCDGDCVDDDALVFPGAPQICDGQNNDCSLPSWPAVPTNEMDTDNDGAPACSDCNDSNVLVHPGAEETCNGIDDNCDGQIDEDGLGLDSDGDGIHNACDNCRTAYNPTQLDTDADGRGNSCDNCALLANADQADTDSDLRGNACDNCPTAYNPFQDDFDSDRAGDACDNCAVEFNPTQSDTNHDGEGDLCDLNDGLIYVLGADDKAYVEWQQESGPTAWNVYTGDLSVLRSTGTYTQAPGSNPLASRTCQVTDLYSFDPIVPDTGKVEYSLVAGVTGGVEGSLGTNSAGTPRPNANSCP